MTKVDKTFVKQYQAAIADGKITDVEAKKLAKSADGSKPREAYLRDHLRQDQFEGSKGRKAVEKAVGSDARRASGFVGQSLGVASNGADVKGVRELGDTKGYTLPHEAFAVASQSEKNAAVVFGKDGKWHAVEVDAGGGTVKGTQLSRDAQGISVTFVPAPAASKAEPTSRNSFAVDLNPPAKTEKAAAQAIFGKDAPPEGFTLQKLGSKWEVLIPSSTMDYPNDVKWEAYQAAVKPEVQQLNYAGADPKFHVPKPGAAVVKQADPDQAEKDKAKTVTVNSWTSGTTLADTIAGTKSIGVTSYDVSVPKPMTKEQAREFFFNENNIPKMHDLDPLPPGSKGPWTQWRVMTPDPGYTPANLDEKRGGLSMPMRLHLAETSTKEQRRMPEWIPPTTAEAIRTKQLPPKSGVTVTHPKEGIAVWQEGKGTFWFNEKTGQVQGFERTKHDGLGPDMWNNWNEAYIKQGMAPDKAAEQTVKDMESTNKQMLMAFAQAMASNRAPEAGIAELVVKTVDVTGKLGLHDQPTGVDDIWAQQRELEAKRAEK